MTAAQDRGRTPSRACPNEGVGPGNAAATHTQASDRYAWTECGKCQDYFAANRSAVIHAAASVGIERGLTTNQALDFYMKERHERQV